MTTPHASTRAAQRAQNTAAAARDPRHARTVRTHSMMRLIGLVLTGVFAFVATGAGAIYYKMQNNIESIDVSDLLAGVDGLPSAPTEDPKDPKAGVPVNILLMGSDDRSGENATIGGEAGGMRSDTTIVMHISADRTRVDLVSIPRDSMVAIPSCTMTDGSTTKAQKKAMFNSAFATGWDNGGDIASAAGCSMLTVMSITDVYLDGFVVVDFAGFQSMIDSIGGVPICLPEAIVSPEANLNLAAGQQTLNGEQALGLARARKGTGLNGSDLTRISRQQELLGATANTLLDKNLLTDAPGLLKFLNAATSSLKASPEFASLQNLSGLAMSLRGIDAAKINFLMVPVADDPADKNRVVWTSAADDVWANIAADRPIDGSTPVEAPTDAPAATPEDAATDEPTSTATTEPTQTATTTAPPKGLTTAADTTATCG
ncbi:transcriptional attenuator, LytR family [Sanguibacter gelidistatuariae]|uniref:Transcriptional attenuator, LytR family n=1 Tax=Sanguibacter gelidistatuariae TaxID=1814289 RepID=A0A1G6QN04_9MICO|nr:LCP family protein [Sanguibacter gelidistatuariae]SDC93708.1 transcriptional attenuator, LytR family [Sanguibacter gelidistatuariae]